MLRLQSMGDECMTLCLHRMHGTVDCGDFAVGFINEETHSYIYTTTRVDGHEYLP